MQKVLIESKKIIFILSILYFSLIIATPPILAADPILGVTYSIAGRFGDNLYCYVHAKWLAYNYNLPFFYHPFRYSNKLALHYQEIHLKDWENRFLHRINYANDMDLNALPANTLLIVPRPGAKCCFKIDWKHPEFNRILNEMIRPEPALPLVHPPKDKVSVAIHFRDGGKFDKSNAKKNHPLKFPPLDFYFSGLQLVLEQYPDKQFYVYIFTDAVHPKDVGILFQDKFKQYNNLEFAFLSSKEDKDQVLIDFFSMFNFDCLIRGESNFSNVVSYLKDFKILVRPKFKVEKGKRVMQGIEIEKNGEL